MSLLRLAAGVRGLPKLLYPRRTAAVWVSRALVDGSDVEWRPSADTITRIEGAVPLWWALQSGGSELGLILTPTTRQ